MKDYSKSLKTLSKGLNLAKTHNPNYIGIMQYYMGTAYQAAGDKNQAKKMFQAALKFFKDHNDNDMIAQAETAIDGLKRRSK